MQNLHLFRLAPLSLRYEAEKQPHGGPRQDANFASCSASDSLAAEFGVSERTIHRDAEFARQVQAASEKFGEQAKIDILKGAVAKDFTCAAIVQSGTCPQLGDYSGRFRLTMELCAPSSMPESPASPRPAPTAIPFLANCRRVARMRTLRTGVLCCISPWAPPGNPTRPYCSKTCPRRLPDTKTCAASSVLQ